MAIKENPEEEEQQTLSTPGQPEVGLGGLASLENRLSFERFLVHYKVVTATDGDGISSPLILAPYGVYPGQTGEIRFMELAANGPSYVGFRSPDAVGDSVSWALPNKDGGRNGILVTDGRTELSFKGIIDLLPSPFEMPGPWIMRQNGDTVTWSHDGTDYYTKVSDGRYIFQTEEGANSNTTFEVWGAGTGQATIKLLTGSDYLTAYHDGTDAVFKLNDGKFKFQTDEGTNTNTTLAIYPKGDANAALELWDRDGNNYATLYQTAGGTYIDSGGPSNRDPLYINPGGFKDVYLFSSATANSAQFRIYGHTTGEDTYVVGYIPTGGEGFLGQSGDNAKEFHVGIGGTGIIGFGFTAGNDWYARMESEYMFSFGDSRDYSIGYDITKDTLQFLDGATHDTNIRAEMDNTGLWKFYNSIALQTTGEIRFYDADNSHYVGFEAPALSATQIWVLPSADGNAGEAIVTDASGNLSFSASVGDHTIYSLIDGTRAFTGVVVGIFPTDGSHLATKEYVDLAINIEEDYFFTDTAHAIAGIYYQMTDTPSEEVESTFVSAALGTGDDQALVNWATNSGVPGTLALPGGVFGSHIHASKTGTKSVNLYYEIYKRTDPGGAETLLLTSEISEAVTTEAAFEIHASIATETDLDTTDILVIKWYANVGSSGSAATVTLYAEGTSDSHLKVPVESSIFNNIYVRRDGTLPLTANWDIGNFTLTANGITIDGTFTDGTATLASGVLAVSTIDIGSTIVVTGTLDEDNMVSDSAVKICTQQSIKKYVDDNSGGAPEGTAVLSTGEVGGTKFLREDGDGTCSWQATAGGSPEGTAVLSTGEVGGTKYLREDGDGTCSWQAVAGGGDVSKVGTPADSQVGVWTGDGTIEGDASFTYDRSNLQLTGDIGSVGTPITKGWFADLQVDNININGDDITMPDDGWVGISNTDERIIFDTTGYISVMGASFGVGTATPATQMQIYGTSAALSITDNNGESELILNSYSIVRTNKIYVTGYDNIVISADHNNEGASSSIRFLIDGTEEARITANGLGIANTAPGALLDLGLAGTTLGVVRLAGSTSGNVSVDVAAEAGTWTLTLPIDDGDAGEFLKTDGNGNTSWDAAGGGVSKWDSDLLPDTPSTEDDHFEAGSLDGKWTEYDHGTHVTVSVSDTFCVLDNDTTAGGLELAGVYQTLPAGDFTIMLKAALVSPAVADSAISLCLFEDATNAAADVLSCTYIQRTRANAYRNFQVFRWTAYNVIGTTYEAGNPHPNITTYQRIRRSGTTLYYEYSFDGVGWHQIYTHTQPFVPAEMGFCVGNRNAVNVSAYVDLFRYIATNQIGPIGQMS